MKRAIDWLNQAEDDLRVAKNLLKNGDYNWVCFLAQQAAEKAIKAMYEASNISVWGHDLQDLLNGLKSTINIPKKVFDVCSILNLYYISTRYPDVFTSGYPAQKFSKSS